LKTLYLY